jgi:rare lipoprotein A (peptidoglycan hydrolase)
MLLNRTFSVAARLAIAGAFLLCTPLLHAPVASNPAQPLALEIKGLTNLANPAIAQPNPNLPSKPLRAWECIAGWYGVPFDGQLTANGEVYDMHGFTAAHPTLPLGSIVRVVDLRTRLSQIVRITDRGPFVAGRELDVSFEVARRLGFDRRGLSRVRLELLEVPKRRPVLIPND